MTRQQFDTSEPTVAAIWRVVEPIAVEAGLELVDVEYHREGRGAVLRLLMDRPGGVSLDDLGAASRQISDVLDVHADAIPGPYTLEVSSPGINRPLTRPEHFRAFVGKRVHVRTRMPLGNRHSFRGTLQSVDETGIVVVADDAAAHAIPFSAIARANYQHAFGSVAGDRPARPRARRRSGAR